MDGKWSHRCCAWLKPGSADNGWERLNRGSKEGVVFNQIKPGQRIQNRKRLLENTESKNRLTNYLVDNWKEENNREKFWFRDNKNNCKKGWWSPSYTREGRYEDQDPCKACISQVIVISEDTGVFVIILGLNSEIGSRILLKRGGK